MPKIHGRSLQESVAAKDRYAARRIEFEKHPLVTNREAVIKLANSTRTRASLASEIILLRARVAELEQELEAKQRGRKT